MFRFISTLLMLSILIGKATAGKVPNIVLQYADSFAQSQTAEKQLPADRTLPDEYARWFFQGFIHPSGGISTKSDLMRDAYTNGQIYWRDHPSERAEIFAGYGYLAVEREGVWSRGFEKSAFQPADADVGEWWITTFGGVAWRDVGLDQPSSKNDRPRVRIVGYLSPKGRYGHLGAYEHEVLVTSGVPVDAGSH